MSWSCPHQTESIFCELRKMKCDPGAENCVIPNKYVMKKDETNSDLDKNIEEE